MFPFYLQLLIYTALPFDSENHASILNHNIILPGNVHFWLFFRGRPFNYYFFVCFPNLLCIYKHHMTGLASFVLFCSVLFVKY